jgi:hypothetical protein
MKSLITETVPEDPLHQKSAFSGPVNSFSLTTSGLYPDAAVASPVPL